MNKILFLGGDIRSIYAAEELKKSGEDVYLYGVSKTDEGPLPDYDILVLPVPTTKDKITVFSPLALNPTRLSFIEETAGDRLVIGCGYNPGCRNFVDLSTLDDFALLNAVPTIEGAIAFAIEKTPFTLWNSNVLIIGNGRIGNMLGLYLKSFGANVTISARKQSDFARLKTQSINFIHTENVSDLAYCYDIIFNTVDAEIFDSPARLKDRIFIDLSSKGAIRNIGDIKDRNIYKLPGLPGKTAPKTAGKIIADTVKGLIIQIFKEK